MTIPSIKKALRWIFIRIIQIKKTRNVSSKHPSGINVVGYIRAEMGLGESCRQFSRSVDAAGIPFNLIELQEGNNSRFADYSMYGKMVDKAKFNTNIIHVNPDQYILIEKRFGRALWSGRFNVGYWYWELPTFPKEWIEKAKEMNEVWSASNYIVQNMEKCLPVPIRKMPFGLSLEKSFGFGRERFGLPEGLFLFLVMYDTTSIMERKNPRGAVEAFKKAFSPDKNDIGIVVKINNADRSPEELKKIKALLSGYVNAFFISQTLTRSEMDDLICCTDVLLSLHRAEGFGLPLAEAMLRRKPVVATAYSGNMDFMNEENSCLIPYRIVEIDHDYGHYKSKGQYWADPDLDAAAKSMLRLYRDSAFRNAIATEGEATIKRLYDPVQAGNRIKVRLQELGL